MNELQIFAFGDNLVRTVQKDGEPQMREDDNDGRDD